MMFIHELEYHYPTTYSELVQLLHKYQNDSKLLAGGTDLILQMKFNRWPQKHIIDVKGVQGTVGFKLTEDYVTVDWKTTLSELLNLEEIKQNYPALWHSINELADRQIRNRGTLVGNICNASPAADTSPVLVAYGASVCLASIEGERVLDITEFFIGPGKTALKPNEFVKEIYFPKRKVNTYCSFQKLGRTYDDIALINAATQLEVDQNLVCTQASIAMGAVGPTTRKAPQAEAFLVGKKLDEQTIKEAAVLASQDASPITDVRATAEYRRKMAGVLVKRTLEKIVQQAQTRNG
jgi:CO/xanthine dehydrogenase FAD-binding subunit